MSWFLPFLSLLLLYFSGLVLRSCEVRLSFHTRLSQVCPSLLPLLSFLPSTFFWPSTYPRALEFSVYSAFLFPSTAFVFVFSAPGQCIAPQRDLINICLDNGGSFQHRGSKKFRAGHRWSSFLSGFRPLRVEGSLPAPQWPGKPQLRFQASTLPLLIVFIYIKKNTMDLHHSLKWNQVP